MTNHVLYYVQAEVLVPFFVNLANNLYKHDHIRPYLLSLLPSDRLYLEKNTPHVYPKYLETIDQIDSSLCPLTPHEIEDACRFMLKKHGGKPSVWHRRLKKVAVYVDELIQTELIDCVVIWNGQDFIGKAITLIARRLGIRTLFLENGYFPNTLQLDPQGVNSASSMNSLPFDVIKHGAMYEVNLADLSAGSYKVEDVKHAGIIERLQLGIKRIADPYYYRRFPELAGGSRVKSALLQLRRKFLSIDQPQLPERFVLIALQVHDDTQILLNSPLFQSLPKFVESVRHHVSTALGNDMTIVVKEHPEDVFRADYKKLRKQYPDLVWIRKSDISKLLHKASLVCVINSSVGLQAIALGKPVVVYGQAFYARPEIAYPVHSLADAPGIIQQAFEKGTHDKAFHIQNFIQYLEQHLFIQCRWRQPGPDEMARICSAVKSHVQAVTGKSSAPPVATRGHRPNTVASH